GIGPEALRQRLEKRDARAGREFVIALENFARQRDARGFTDASEQPPALLDQAFRARLRLLAPAARQQSAAALRNVLQQCPEKRGVHLLASAAWLQGILLAFLRMVDAAASAAERRQQPIALRLLADAHYVIREPCGNARGHAQDQYRQNHQAHEWHDA